MLDDAHYRLLAIEPIAVHRKHNLNYTAYAFLKYLTRYKHKGGLRDLKQARDFCINETLKERVTGLKQAAICDGLDNTIMNYCIDNTIEGDRRFALVAYFKGIQSINNQLISNAYFFLDRYIKDLELRD